MSPFDTFSVSDHARHVSLPGEVDLGAAVDDEAEHFPFPGAWVTVAFGCNEETLHFHRGFTG
jgi:hypothetical protein